MPCSDGSRACYEENPELRRSADASTRAACDMRTILRRANLEHMLTVETRKWIAKHDAADAKRIAEENAAGIRQRVKQQALDKLTLEERRVLGL